MFSKNHPIILFIDRSGFSIFQDTQPNIPRFNFTPDLVANLDVVNKEPFSNLIATFIQINKIIPSSLAIILSDSVIYSKDLVNPLQKQTSPSQPLSNEDVQNFLEDVPFEEVLAKVIKIDKPCIVAVNKDLVMTIADVFVSKGSTIETIIPSFMYGSNVNFAAGLTQDNILVILGESEILRTGNLLTDQQRMTSPQSLETDRKEKEKDPQNLRQYLLVGIFVTLLAILAIVYLNLGASQTPPKSSRTKSSFVNTTGIPTIIPTSTQTLITAAPLDIENIKVKIVQSSEENGKAISLKSGLLGMGLTDIISEISEISIPEKSSVIFSQNIPTDLRINVIIEIKKILPDISVLESQDSDFTINITIGKS